MFSQVSEKKMIAVRVILFFGWLLLIGSLFYDPITPYFTEASNTNSLFRIKYAIVYVQDRVLVDDKPYSMSSLIFWTIAVPLLPLYFMVFGHEAWRRICPLSFVSQIPRLLGIQRKKNVFQRRTGKLEKVLFLIDKNGWLKRNVWYVQLGLLFVGLVLRILAINSDRRCLAFFFISVICLALLVGYLWGGKTWCNYFCPINVVQKIYTEPRGLLESKPHIVRIPISQSMCRKPSLEGDKSTCVACISPCGDIDLEKAYWETIDSDSKRNAYYIFFGLIVGYISYYYLYAGNWDYYYSGIWTHEVNVLNNLFGAGLYINHHKINLPKIIAAPCVIAIFGFVSLLLWQFLEKIYRKIMLPKNMFSEAELVNHCLSFCAYLSINTFYLFAGRPNIMLLPNSLIRFIDIVLVAVSSAWFFNAIMCSPHKYRRASLASSLLEQLKKLKIDIGKYLDGKRLEDLKPDEIYVLTKVVPAFSSEQKINAYSAVLEDAIVTGKTASAISLDLLKEMREKMGISEELHAELLEKMGGTLPAIKSLEVLDVSEKQRALVGYTEMLAVAVLPYIECGTSLKEALLQTEIQSSIAILQASFQITPSEHALVERGLLGADGALTRKFIENSEALKQLLSVNFCISAFSIHDHFQRTLSLLLADLINKKTTSLAINLLGFIKAWDDTTLQKMGAYNIRALMGDNIKSILEMPIASSGHISWFEVFNDEIIALLLDKYPNESDINALFADGIKRYTYRDVINNGLSIKSSFGFLLNERDPFILALSISMLFYMDEKVATQFALDLAMREGLANHWLLDEMLDKVNKNTHSEQHNNSDYISCRFDTIEKMVYLFLSPYFSKLELESLACIARDVEVKHYDKGALITRQKGWGDIFYSIQNGSVDVFQNESQDEKSLFITLNKMDSSVDLGCVNEALEYEWIAASDDTVLFIITNAQHLAIVASSYER